MSYSDMFDHSPQYNNKLKVGEAAAGSLVFDMYENMFYMNQQRKME